MYRGSGLTGKRPLDPIDTNLYYREEDKGDDCKMEEEAREEDRLRSLADLIFLLEKRSWTNRDHHKDNN